MKAGKASRRRQAADEQRGGSCMLLKGRLCASLSSESPAPGSPHRTGAQRPPLPGSCANPGPSMFHLSPGPSNSSPCPSLFILGGGGRGGKEAWNQVALSPSSTTHLCDCRPRARAGPDLGSPESSHSPSPLLRSPKPEGADGTFHNLKRMSKRLLNHSRLLMELLKRAF